MENGFNTSGMTETSGEDVSTKVSKDAHAASITQVIGTGENAKNSFVYLTLKWAFISGIAITGLIFLNGWIFRQNEKVPDVIDEVRTAWEIIVPLVTLALGYAFGKSKN